MALDPILTPSNERYVAKPKKKYPELWAMYKKHENLFWTLEELEFGSDIQDWKKLNDNEKHFLKSVLAFFAASDGIVNENLCTRFCNEVQAIEALYFYMFQMAIENIHSETYSELINTFVKDEEEKDFLFNAIETMPIVKKKAKWAFKHIESQEKFAHRLLAFAAVEGIFFSSSFCSIYWLADRGLMVSGLKKSNEFIARDEALHTNFAIALHRHLQPENRLDKETAHEIFREAAEIEFEFAKDALPVSMIGMNCDKMIEYIKFCTDRLSQQAGFGKIYNARNPFLFMEKINLQSKANFHEQKESNYQMGTEMTREELEIAFEEFF